MKTTDQPGAIVVLAACCLAVSFPGALIFGFPGVMGRYWQVSLGVNRADVGLILFYILAGAGLFMFIIGRLQHRIGPATLVFLGSLCGGAAMIAVGFAESIRAVYLWGFANGAASAFAYLPGITVAQGWFPRHRGLAAGLVSMCFGLSGALLAPLFIRLLQLFGVGPLTVATGMAAVAVGSAAALFIRVPAAGPGGEPAAAQPAMTGQLSVTSLQSLKTRSFWLLWFTYAFAGGAGISMVTLSVGFGISRGLSPAAAVLILTFFNITNGLSRLVSGYLSDVAGRKQIMGTSFLLAGLSFFLFPHLSYSALWWSLAAVIGFSFGTLHSVTAPLVSDCFGLQHFGSIFGMIFTAFGFFSGLIGPWLGGWILELSGGNYIPVFYYLGGLLMVSTVLIWVVSPKAECTF